MDFKVYTLIYWNTDYGYFPLRVCLNAKIKCHKNPVLNRIEYIVIWISSTHFNSIKMYSHKPNDSFWYINTDYYRDTDFFSEDALVDQLEEKAIFYSEIPLPFPNSSYLLEPSNPMANAEMRFLRLYNNLNQAIGLQ